MAITTEEELTSAQEQTQGFLGSTGFESFEDLEAAVQDISGKSYRISKPERRNITSDIERANAATAENIQALYTGYTPEQTSYLQKLATGTKFKGTKNWLTFDKADYTPAFQTYKDIQDYEKLTSTSGEDTQPKTFGDYLTQAREGDFASAGFSSAYEYAQALQQQDKDIIAQQEAAASPIIQEAEAAGMPTTEDEVAAAKYMKELEIDEANRAFFENVWGTEEDFAQSFKDFYTSEQGAIKGQEARLRGDVGRQYESADIARRQSLAARGIDPGSGLAVASQNQLLGMQAEAQAGITQGIDQQLLQSQQNFLQMGLGNQPAPMMQLQGFGQQLSYYQQQQMQQAGFAQQQQMQQAGFAQQQQQALQQYGWQKDLMNRQLRGQREGALYSLAGTAIGTAAGFYFGGPAGAAAGGSVGGQLTESIFT